MFLIGFSVGIALTLLVIVLLIPKFSFIVKESKLNFTETVETIVSSAVEEKWNVAHQYDLQATLKKHSLEVQPIHVLSLCKPEHAYEILSSSNERMVSALMPCRVAVYEKDGKTYISMLNAGFLSKFMGSKIRTVMGAASLENELILSPVVKNP